MSDRPRVPSVVAGLLLLGGAFAPALHGQAGQISYEAFTLPNGLRVIYSEDHSTPIVSVDVWYNTGSRNERPGRSGFAHLFEHMMFEGSAHVKKGEHFQRISRAGGSENGSTGEDRTNYYETLPSNRLNLALWLEADRMRSLAITDEHFQNQRAAQLSDVRAFFDTYYAPNNATLVVVGDFRPLELRRYVNQYFSEIPRHTEPPAVSCSARLSPGVERREVTDAHANLPAVLRIYRAPPHADPDTRALELLNVILGQGESSRLNVAVVRREKAAFGTQVFMNPFDSRRGPGVLLVLAIANQGVDPLKLDTIVTAQLDSIRAAGVTDEELQKAKSTFRAGFVHARETTLGKAEELHHYDMFHPSLAEINSDLDRVLAVTTGDVRRVAAKYLDPANAVVIVVKLATGGGAQ